MNKVEENSTLFIYNILVDPKYSVNFTLNK